jgi:hypothetical protein
LRFWFRGFSSVKKNCHQNLREFLDSDEGRNVDSPFHNVFTHNCKTFKMVVYLVEKIINIKNFTIFRSFQTLKRWLPSHRLLLGFYIFVIILPACCLSSILSERILLNKNASKDCLTRFILMDHTQIMQLHCKKRLAVFKPPASMSLTESIIPCQVEFGKGKSLTFYYSVRLPIEQN